MMSLPLAIDAVVATLLVATIAYAAVLNRRLAALRRTRAEMEALVGRFGEVAGEAQRGLAEVKAAAGESGETLQHRLEEARSLADDLAFLTEKGTGLADRLEAQITAGRKQAPPLAAVAGGASARPRTGAENDAAASPEAEAPPAAATGTDDAAPAAPAAAAGGEAEEAPLWRILRQVR